MTEALLAVADAAQGQTDGLGLSQEVGSQGAVGELPEVLAAHEGVGDGEQHGLLAAIAGQCERGDAGDVHGVAAAQDTVKDLSLRAQHAAGLDVDDDLALGKLLNLLLEGSRNLAHNGPLKRVDLGIGQLHGRRHSGRSAERNYQDQEQGKQLLHNDTASL